MEMHNLNNKYDGLELHVYIKAEVNIKVHSLETGDEEEVEMDSIYSMEDEDGHCVITYCTDNEECQLESFTVIESMEEVNRLYNNAVDLQKDVHENAVIISKSDLDYYKQLKAENK